LSHCIYFDTREQAHEKASPDEHCQGQPTENNNTCQSEADLGFSSNNIHLEPSDCEVRAVVLLCVASALR